MPARSQNPIPAKYRSWVTIGVILAIIIIGLLQSEQTVKAPPESTPTANASGTMAASSTLPADEESLRASGSLPGWLSIYFTNPTPPDNLGHGIDKNV